MKLITKKSEKVISALILTGILSLTTGLTLLYSASAAPNIQLQQLVKDKPILISDDYEQEDKNSDRSNRLPRNLANAVRQDLSNKVGIPIGKLKILEYSRQTWSDGCLGIPEPNQACTEALVEGWRITVSNGKKNWVYRSDRTGQVLRLEKQAASSKLPTQIANAVLEAASARTKLPTSQLRIVKTERRQWQNGCLGLSSPGTACTQVIVPGWLVTVEAGKQRLVYRTGNFGSKVVLDEAASKFADNGVKPTQIPVSELPPDLKRGEVFQVITTGGFTGRTYKTTLMADGKLIRGQVNFNGTTSQPQTSQITQEQVRRFQQLLETQNFSQFNGLSYVAVPKGAADYTTIYLNSQYGTSRYTDITQDRLPSSLKRVIEVWNQLVTSAK